MENSNYNKALFAGTQEIVNFFKSGQFVRLQIQQKECDENIYNSRDSLSWLIDNAQEFINTAGESILNSKARDFFNAFELMCNISEINKSGSRNTFSDFYKYIKKEGGEKLAFLDNPFLYNYQGQAYFTPEKILEIHNKKEGYYPMDDLDMQLLLEASDLQEKSLIVYIMVTIRKIISTEIFKVELVKDLLCQGIAHGKRSLSNIAANSQTFKEATKLITSDPEDILSKLLGAIDKSMTEQSSHISKSFLSGYEEKLEFVQAYEKYIHNIKNKAYLLYYSGGSTKSTYLGE